MAETGQVPLSTAANGPPIHAGRETSATRTHARARERALGVRSVGRPRGFGNHVTVMPVPSLGLPLCLLPSARVAR